MSDEPITSHQHDDLVGDDASRYRIPGAEKATTGHHYVAVYPKEGEQQATSELAEARVSQEHLPPPTGRDVPPKGLAKEHAPAATDLASFTERLAAARNSAGAKSPPRPQIPPPGPLPPAPDSVTVVDPSPWDTPPPLVDTLPGVTSKDVDKGLGHPGEGMTSRELRHDGKQHRKRSLTGKDQYGSHVIPREEPEV